MLSLFFWVTTPMDAYSDILCTKFQLPVSADFPTTPISEKKYIKHVRFDTYHFSLLLASKRSTCLYLKKEKKKKEKKKEK